MENKNLKNILVAAGLAVFAGVLTLGVNAAFGSVDAPTQNPADASLHSPRFNDVDVNGNLVNSTTTPNPTGAGSEPLNNPVKIDDPDGLGVVGSIKNLDAQSFTFGGIAMSIPPVTVEGDLKITGTNGNLDINGKILNSKETAGGSGLPVTIFDGLDVASTVTAERFGTYFEEDSTLEKINKNTTKQVSVSCPVDTYLVSCQSMTASSNIDSGGAADFTNNFTKDVYINYAYADQDADNDGNATENDNVCKVRGFNANQTTDRYIGASAVCLNPSI